MTNEKTLLDMIQKMVENKTFSLEGLQAIAKLRENAVANETKLLEYEESIKRLKLENERFREVHRELTKNIEDWKVAEKNKETIMAVREKNVSNLETRTAVAEAKENTLQSVFQMLFKNTVVRESVQRSVVSEIPAQYSGGYPTTHTRVGDSDTKTIEKE